MEQKYNGEKRLAVTSVTQRYFFKKIMHRHFKEVIISFLKK